MLSDLYIDGTWHSRPTTLPVSDPASGEELATVSLASVEDCIAAVEAAAAAGADWARVAPRERAEILRRAYELLVAEADVFAALITAENGKALAESVAEVRYAADFFRWYSEEAVRLEGALRRAPGGDKQIAVLPRPVGVAVMVTPWNFPAAMITRKLAPALAAGCTAVVKPALETPLTALAVADLLERAGAPPGVVNVVLPEPPGAAVRAMLAHPAVRKLSFTGSTAVGISLLEAAAPHVLRCSMELGGNAAFVVFDDADLDTAVEAALVAKLRNTGASCVAANRFYVHARIADEFVDTFGSAMAARRMGPGADPANDLGALVNPEERDKVGALVDVARDAGATAVLGGSAPGGPGAFYPPTVLTDVVPDNPILDEEIFGPVAPIVLFDPEEQAIEMANDTRAGLIAYVMTSDLARGIRVAEALDVGMVGLNRGVVSDASAPFGGVKLSGLGKEGGHEGIDEYLEHQYIALDW